MEINNKKCYSCGKEFKKPIDLERHKNRKTPCLIREIPDAHRANPNRCIFCNKVFVQRQTLVRHLTTCKIKNGGMDILDEKVRYEQEIRIMKDQRNQDAIKIQKMEEQMEEMKKTVDEMKKKVVAPQLINNGIINITFNNYDKPAKTFAIGQEDLLVENITKKLIEMIYFNKDVPSNHTIYLPNIKEKRLLIHRNNSWETISGDTISKTLVSIKNSARMIGMEKVNEIYSNDTEFAKLYPVVREAIVSFNSGGTHANCSDEELMEIIKSKRDLVVKTLRSVKVI